MRARALLFNLPDPSIEYPFSQLRHKKLSKSIVPAGYIAPSMGAHYGMVMGYGHCRRAIGWTAGVLDGERYAWRVMLKAYRL